MQVPVPPPRDFERLYPDGDADSTQAVMNILRTNDLLTDRIAHHLRPYGISPAGGLVLGILLDADEPIPPGLISERLIVTRATVTGLLDSLEKRRMLRRRAHPGDRRMVLVELTDLGRSSCVQFRKVLHRAEAEWMSALSSAERRRLVGLLARMQKTLISTEPREDHR